MPGESSAPVRNQLSAKVHALLSSGGNGNGSDAWAPAKPRPDETLIRAGAGASVEADARGGEVSLVGRDRRSGGRVTRSFVNRLLRLTLPDIQEAIFDGRQPKGMQLEELTRTMPSGWAEQRESVAIGQSA